MFREMRRKKQELSHEECISVLNKCTSGVLAVDGDDNLHCFALISLGMGYYFTLQGLVWAQA